MKKAVKMCLILAVVLVLAGIVAVAAGLTMGVSPEDLHYLKLFGMQMEFLP